MGMGAGREAYNRKHRPPVDNRARARQVQRRASRQASMHRRRITTDKPEEQPSPDYSYDTEGGAYPGYYPNGYPAVPEVNPMMAPPYMENPNNVYFPPDGRFEVDYTPKPFTNSFRQWNPNAEYSAPNPVPAPPVEVSHYGQQVAEEVEQWSPSTVERRRRRQSFNRENTNEEVNVSPSRINENISGNGMNDASPPRTSPVSRPSGILRASSFARRPNNNNNNNNNNNSDEEEENTSAETIPIGNGLRKRTVSFSGALTVFNGS